MNYSMDLIISSIHICMTNQNKGVFMSQLIKFKLGSLLLGLIALSFGADAEAFETRALERGFLHIVEATCFRNFANDGKAEFKIKASYYDADRNRLSNLPMFIQYSPDPRHPWAFAINHEQCDSLFDHIREMRNYLIPISMKKIERTSSRTVDYECGPLNRRTGDRGRCTRTIPLDTVYIQYYLDDLLFTSYAE